LFNKAACPSLQAFQSLYGLGVPFTPSSSLHAEKADGNTQEVRSELADLISGGEGHHESLVELPLRLAQGVANIEVGSSAGHILNCELAAAAAPAVSRQNIPRVMSRPPWVCAADPAKSISLPP
jgi:hypothetical protein